MPSLCFSYSADAVEKGKDESSSSLGQLNLGWYLKLAITSQAETYLIVMKGKVYDSK